MKKICLVLPNLKAGGQERVMSYLANYFVEKSEIEIHLILLTKTDKAYYLSPKVILHEPKFQFNNKNRIFSTIKTFIYLRKNIRYIKPYSILSFGEGWNNFVLLAVTGFTVKKFISDRCNPLIKLPFIHRILTIVLYPKSTGIIVQTKLAKELMKKKFQKNMIYVVGNPVREISIENRKRENIILNVGRFVPTKQQKLLIEVFESLNPVNWKLVFLGKGVNLEECKEYVMKHNLSEKVIFMDEVSDVDDYYLRSKIFAYMSTSEGFPNAICEAMSAQVAIISFDFVAGATELISNNKNGMLIPLGDIDCYKQKLKELMDNESLRLEFELNAKKTISKFNTSIICEEYFQIITN